MVRVSRGRLGAVGLKPTQPLRALHYLGTRLAYRFRLKRVPALPVMIDIEPNNTCNYRCPHCQVTHWSKESAYLGEDGFRRILGQLPRLVRIKLQGMGEPLLNKSLASLLELGESRGIRMSFFTNGSIMSDETAGRLARLSDTEITVSLDGASAEVFERMRAGGRFERVQENIRRLVGARGGRTSPLLSAWTVVTRENASELPRIVRLARDLGLDRITIQTFLSDWGKESMRAYAGEARVDAGSTALASSLTAARDAAAECGIDLAVSSRDYYTRQHPCTWPWTSAYIAANGDVVPCCIIADAETMKMGNVFEERFSVIWNSEIYRRFRDAIARHDLPPFCRNCYRDAGPS